MNRLWLAAACLAGLCLSTSNAQAQYPGGYGGGYGGGRPPRARLSPYLALTNGGDAAGNYHLGVVPERERRFNESLLGGRLRQLELQQDTLEARRSLPAGGDELISAVPIA